jgi:acyl-CoA-binding protein
MCARRPAFTGPPVAATALPAFNFMALFDKKLAFKLVESRFDEISKKVDETTGIPKPMQATLYGLFKQAVEGNAPNGPGLFGNHEKWESWFSCQDMDKLQAMQKYINIALKCV